MQINTKSVCVCVCVCQSGLECEECVQSSVACEVFPFGSEVGFFCWSLKVLRLSVTYSWPAGTHTHTHVWTSAVS